MLLITLFQFFASCLHDVRDNVLKGQAVMKHWAKRLAAGCIAAATMVSVIPAASAAETTTDPLSVLLTEFNTYWTKPGEPYDGTGTGGSVLNTAVLQYNDEVTVAINNAAAVGATETASTEQQQRALSDRDADSDVATAFKDGFGPILGEYFAEGYNNGDLEAVKDIMENNGWSGNPAKADYQSPRPYTQRDKWLPNAEALTSGSNDLNGLAATLDIYQVPDGIGSDGKTHSADYPKNSSEGSFPSGHTNKAYSRGVALAAIMPELAPEILARTSEAGNNRIVLGVHYALDVMGGRIGGHASNGAFWSDANNTERIDAAYEQLHSYLTERCSADGYGDTLAECIANTGANASKGYQNSFTDAVSTKPVTDRQSAIDAYTTRMTYGFDQVTAAGQSFTAPEGAAELLRFAYPDLSIEQRNQVLAATAIDSGYPLDSSAQGWDRINLARALSSKVTLNTEGAVVSVENADTPSVVTVSDPDDGNDNNDNGNTNNNGSDNNGNTDNGDANNNNGNAAADGSANGQNNASGDGALASTGVSTSVFVVLAMAMTAAGAALAMMRRQQQ